MLLKNNFTVILASLSDVSTGYSKFSADQEERDPDWLKPVKRGECHCFYDAWSTFGEIVDKGGLLFASFDKGLTYGFSRWIGLLPMAKWCRTRVITVEIDDSPNSYVRFLEVQDQAMSIRGIDLRRTPSEGWSFHQFGELFPFEREEKLTSKSVNRRFDIDDIQLFLSQVGAALINRNDLSRRGQFCVLQHGSTKDHKRRQFRELSVAERTELLSLSPITSEDQSPGRFSYAADYPENGPPRCPSHIFGFFCRFQDWEEWGLGDLRKNAALSVGKVMCSCGSLSFTVVQEEKNLTILARCSRCRKEIILYNLRMYPGITLLPGPASKGRCLAGERDKYVSVTIAYEYPDGSDDLANTNAITWCTIWCKEAASGRVFKVLDHETT
jgi:hypothetical protein